MIFLTLGSQKFQFNRLLMEVDRLVEEGRISEPVFAQIGYSDYKPLHYKYSDFLSRDDFSRKMQQADLVIAHGGTGAIIGALKMQKKVIAVPRKQKFGEHVDDHQQQIVKSFDAMHLICGCQDTKELFQCYEEARKQSYATYQSNTNRILDDIGNYIDHN